MQTLQQIFKQIPDLEYIKHIIDTICFKERETLTYKKYYINEEIFKSYVFNDSSMEIVSDLHSYYHNSKLKYLQSLHKYKNFITILRQLCKTTEKIQYEKKIKYQFNNYKIEYTICILE